MQTKVIEAILESDIPSFEKISKTTEKWWGGRIAGFNIMQICGQLGDEEMAKALMSEAECDDALYAVLEEKYMNQLTPHDMSALFGFLKTATVLKHKTDAESNIPSKANLICNDPVRDAKNGGYSSNPSTTAAIINIRKNTLKMHGNKRMSVGTPMSVSNEKYTKNDALDSHSALYELETPVFRIKAENGTFRGTDSCNTMIVRGWDSKTNVNSDLIIAESTDDSELFINIDWIKLDSISFERSMKLEEVTDSEAENSLQTCRDSAECTVLKVGGFSPLERYRNMHNYKIGPYPQYSFLGPQFLQVFLAGNCGQQYSVEIDVDISTPYLSKNEIGDKKSEELKYIQTHYNWRVPNDVTLLCGHRGSGANSAVGGDGVRLQLRENTIKSMYEAHRSGASVVEFDIQLSRDSVPVVHHDWGTVVENGLKVQINDLTVQQFQGLGSCIQPQTSGALAASSNTNSNDTMSRIHFTFEELLEGLPMDLGMNVEIKYPISDEAKYFGVEKAFELNWRYATKKHSHENTSGEHTPLNNVPVIFSSFHPDVCILLKRKVGHIFPVFFLTMGGVYKLSNPLCNSVAQAVNFATLHGLSGVVSDSVAITDAPSLVHFVHASGLSLATYGRRNNDADFVRIQCDSHVNMIITDSVRMVKSVLEEK
ncbi:Glycerophosphodiester phosphodiesterase gde1 [Zancudomyces culisetae]|uniref:Glycerophosphodiester phosphodiesterase gde1 n=1 Tax=Zancudomyces culisetae TaxID=1213189 RepID=A0A1R1PKR4_ZANCU|nr:Glycerophosphodiester phosphodiesterase gde1 [Zancudomyces culisetae]|eukprot:OMH81527.1 Glycerophosphodiester phosphodiesterase gde1 [Zancudomyces culisetae]